MVGSIGSDPRAAPPYVPPYGDLTLLNTERTILDSVGAEHLRNIVGDFVHTLGTSAAVYERNGDYALGIFASSWCRLLDAASRRLCGTVDNAAALASGRWLCHESCWTDASRLAIETGRAADIACNGGLRIFALPIMAENKVIGAINFGYGAPPSDKRVLKDLAHTYAVPLAELMEARDQYLPRSEQCIVAARRRLETAARLIGTIVELHQSRKQLTVSEQHFHALFENAPLGYQSLNEEGRILQVNQAWVETLGYRRDEVLGRWFGDFLAPDCIDSFEERFPQFKRSGSTRCEFGMRHHDGTIRRIVFEGRVAYNTDGSFRQTHCILTDVTNQRQAEEALRRSEASLRALVDGLPDIIVRSDRNGRILFASESIAEGSGVSASEFLGKTSAELGFPEEMNRFWLESIQSVFDSRESTEKEFSLQSSNEHKVFNWRIVPEFDSNDKVTTALSVVRDITDLRRIQRDYQTLFREMLDGFALHEIICDSEGKPIDYRFLDINPAFERMTGLSREIVGKRVLEIMPGTEPHWIETYGRVALTGQPVFFENYSREIGKYFTVTSFRPAPNQFACIFADVTDRRRSEKKVRIAESRLRSLIEHTSDEIYCLEFDAPIPTDLPKESQLSSIGLGKLADCNPLCARSFGVDSTTEILGEKVSEIIARGRLRGLDEVLRQLVARDYQTVEIVVHADWAKGEERDLLHTANGVLEDGELVRIWGTIRDVTDRRRAEEELNNIQRLESLGVLAGGIAHDFNNLLGGIFGFIDLAGELATDPDVSNYLSKALGTIDRARGLTQQLLTFAKGGTPLRKIDSLPAFIEETVTFALSGSNISCNIDIEKDLWLCSFDRNQIAQVIDNLIINALHATPAGGNIELRARNVRFSDTAHPRLPKGYYVLISVQDWGVGIPKGLLDRIFDPFFTTKEKGHGLGLSTCHSIVNRHGGCIEVESEQGKGSTFKVYLPAMPSAILPNKQVKPLPFRGSGIVAVVDDEPIIREIMAEVLTMQGYTPICFGDGAEVLRFFKENEEERPRIAAMIFDLTIPGGMGGVETVGEIRKHDPTVPVFVASGYKEDPVMANPTEYGFTAGLSKPFTQGELVELFRTYLH